MVASTPELTETIRNFQDFQEINYSRQVNMHRVIHLILAVAHLGIAKWCLRVPTSRPPAHGTQVAGVLVANRDGATGIQFQCTELLLIPDCIMRASGYLAVADPDL